MEVIILAGGLGTRLRSVVNEVPKCMAPVAGRPFLWYLLKYLARYNISRVVLSVGYLREAIFKWMEEVKGEFPFEFDYAIEEEPLGTGGGIRMALSKVKNDRAFVLNGDTFFEVKLDKLYDCHIVSKKSITLALKPMKDFERYGSVDLDKKTGTILSFNEKKYCKEGLINGGVYVVEKNAFCFDNFPSKFSFETAILEPLCATNKLLGVVMKGYFIDIGIPEDYQRANYEFSSLF